MTGRIEVWGGLLLACALVGPATSQQAVSREDFLAEQDQEGWIPIGEFGRVWPAVPVRGKIAEDSIAFVLASGQPHSYPGYEGYALTVVFLQAPDGRETVVVFRSERKRGE